MIGAGIRAVGGRWSLAALAIAAPGLAHAEDPAALSGPAAVLKNALDWVYPEWNRKAAAFVSYGSVSGARSVQRIARGPYRHRGVRNQIRTIGVPARRGRADCA